MNEKTINEFLEALASKSPVPGGGGAAALVGAVGMALSNMAGNLTLGKKKYAEIQGEVEELLEEGYKIMENLKALIDKDAEAFKPLSQAYRLPADTPERAKRKEETVEEYSKAACLPPLEIMQSAFAGIKILERIGRIGSPVAVSDAGCGIALLKAALISGSLNIIINTNAIKDQEFVLRITREMDDLLEKGCQVADETFQVVMDKLKKRR